MKTRHPLVVRSVVLVYLAILIGLPVVFLVAKALQHGFGPFWSQITQPDAVAALVLSVEVAAIAVPVNALVGVGAALLDRSPQLHRSKDLRHRL